MSADHYTPADAIDAANAAFHTPEGSRALHAKGVVCAGTFRASEQAAKLSRAGHFQGEEVRVIARFSNGAGNPGHPDYAPDPRGLAVKFILEDNSRTDVVAVSTPAFPAATPDAFIALLKAQAEGPKAMLAMIRANPGLVPKLARAIPSTLPPAGYQTTDYHALHAFGLINAAGDRQWIRYHLRSSEPARRLSPGAAKKRGRSYLTDGLIQRLSERPIVYALEAELAAPGDPVNDPSAAWPRQRRHVRLGAITIDRVDPTPEENGNILVFDPTRVTDGIECSDDPVLHFRSPAYTESVLRRSGVQRSA